MNQGCWKVDENDEEDLRKADRYHHFSNELWTELYKTKSTGSKAIYLDKKRDGEEETDEIEYSQWSYLPDLLLERIFSFLSIREKYYASLVCRNWYRAFNFPYVWSEFVLEDSTLTRARFNYYSGWQYVLDHVRAQMCLSAVGRNFKKLTIRPMYNFYNLYEFMNMISWYTEQEKAAENVQLGVGSNIETLKFTFLCNMTARDDTERVRLFGTGGKLLASLKRLMSNLLKLKHLELIDLMLDPQEAQFLLDEVCDKDFLTLKELFLVNTTRVQYQLLHVGVFIHLDTLIISPQNLGNEVIDLLSHTNLKHLHILQNRYTPHAFEMKINSVSLPTWKNCRKNNPLLKVHLKLETIKDKPLVWQEGAPVWTVLYDSPHIGVNTMDLDTTISFYSKTLRVYGHKNIPRFYHPKRFDQRNDGNLLWLVRQCPHLTTLIVTERISTATTLLIAYTAKKLERFYVRGNAIVLKFDWPRNPEWTDEFYTWLHVNSRSYGAVEREISQMMGSKWRFLSDKDFKKLECNLHDE